MIKLLLSRLVKAMNGKLLGRITHFFVRSSVVREAGLFPEHQFREILTTERKRTERSGKPFLLVLIDMSGLLASRKFDNKVRSLVHALCGSSREIDLRGWYTADKVLGIIFIEASAASKPIVIGKITSVIAKELGGSQVDLVNISVLSFPQETGNVSPTAAEELRSVYPTSVEQFQANGLFLVKRIIDIVCSAIAITFLSPLFLIIAILIKLTSKGPVIFRQTRLGLGGRHFTFLKFRSMYSNTDSRLHQEYISSLIGSGNAKGKEPEKVWCKLENDPRITRIGKFLRKTSLDELPQLFNVLRGDMALVGPRPPIPYEFGKYSLWHKRRILEIKPGITGYWQVQGRSATTFDNMVRMDIQYGQKWSLWLDLKLLFLTPLAVITTRGAS